MTAEEYSTLILVIGRAIYKLQKENKLSSSGVKKLWKVLLHEIYEGRLFVKGDYYIRIQK